MSELANLLKSDPYGESKRPYPVKMTQAEKDKFAKRDLKNLLTDAALFANSFMPVTGDIQSGILAANDVKKGDYKSAALNAVGLLPFIPALAGVLGKNSDSLANVLKQVPDEYGIAHRPPMKDNGGAPLHDLTGGGNVYPDDIYSKQASQYYGTGDRGLDAYTIAKIKAYKDKPDLPINMYRAVGKDVPEDAVINNGDWVTINPDYAKQHGESALYGDYRILQQQVPARKLFTNGDSIHEFGYDQNGKISPEMLGVLAAGSAGGIAYAHNKKKNKKRNEQPLRELLKK